MMRATGIVFAFFLAAAPLSAVAQSPTAAPSTISSTPMLDCSGLPCVEVTVANGKHLRLAIDTGNPQSILTPLAAATAGVVPKPYIGRDGKTVPNIATAIVPQTVVGSHLFGDEKFVVIDLSQAIKDGTFPDVDGTLAYGAFHNRTLTLDYAAHTVGFSDVHPAAARCPAARCGTISLITFGVKGPPIVTTSGFTLNGKPLQVQVDTMYTGTMLVYPAAVAKFGLSTAAQSGATRHFPFTDEGVDMTEGRADSEGFASTELLTHAPLYFAGPRVHLPDGLFDGTVGAQLFAGHRVSMDFASMYFWLE